MLDEEGGGAPRPPALSARTSLCAPPACALPRLASPAWPPSPGRAPPRSNSKRRGSHGDAPALVLGCRRGRRPGQLGSSPQPKTMEKFIAEACMRPFTILKLVPAHSQPACDLARPQSLQTPPAKSIQPQLGSATDGRA
eukprot:SM004353S15767  [mRNA]  locus=s4353:20:527:- [translate_table: standard]